MDNRKIYDILLKIGVSPVSLGFGYIVQGLNLIFDDETCLEHITKTLYIDIAKKTGTSAKNIEQCIRNCIAVAWSHNGKEFREKLFKCEKAPTNSQFFARLCEYLKKK